MTARKPVRAQNSKRRSGAHNSAKPLRKPRGKGKPFQPGNPWRIQPGEKLNPGGRPKLLSHAYLDWLAAENDQGVSNAAGVAIALGQKAVDGDIAAARELRQTTEGDKFTFDLTKATDEQLQRIIDGEDPRVVLTGASPGRAGAAQPAQPGDQADQSGN